MPVPFNSSLIILYVKLYINVCIISYNISIYIVVYNTFFYLTNIEIIKSSKLQNSIRWLFMSKDVSLLNVRISNDLKKELKLISVYEETTIKDIVIGFIEYGVKVYNTEQRLIKDK